MKRLEAEGRIVFSSSGTAYRKLYLHESKGIAVKDVITNMASVQGNESEDYPTQKPIKLLDRIIKASSNEGDLVLDPFCGSGTTLVAAELLDRRYIGIDINQNTIDKAHKRLNEAKMPLFCD